MSDSDNVIRDTREGTTESESVADALLNRIDTTLNDSLANFGKAQKEQSDLLLKAMNDLVKTLQIMHGISSSPSPAPEVVEETLDDTQANVETVTAPASTPSVDGSINTPPLRRSETAPVWGPTAARQDALNRRSEVKQEDQSVEPVDVPNRQSTSSPLNPAIREGTYLSNGGSNGSLSLKLFGKPEKFSGEDLSLYDNFIDSLDHVFDNETTFFDTNTFLGNKNRIEFLRNYTTGEANFWVRSWITSNVGRHTTCNKLWEACAYQFEQRWKDHYAKVRAQAELGALKQGKGAGKGKEYVDKFNTLCVVAGQSAHYRAMDFYNNLTANHKVNLHQQGVDKDDVRAMQKAVIEYDQLNQVVSADYSVARNQASTSALPQPAAKAAATPVANGPVMRNSILSRIKCHKCSKMGHYANNCPDRQVNLVEVDEEEVPDDDEEFNLIQFDSSDEEDQGNGQAD